MNTVKKTTLNRILFGIMILCLSGAVTILGIPAVRQIQKKIEDNKQIAAFNDKYGGDQYQTPDDTDTVGATDSVDSDVFANLTHIDPPVEAEGTTVLDHLWADAKAYNTKLYEDGITGTVRDYKGTQVLDFDLTDYGFEDQMFGYIDIPAINLRMCLYTYTSRETLFAGACRLSNTSIPIGGINTNAVIAGHSGYSDPMFTYIGKLEEGDRVYITNPWGTMTYVVTGKAKVLPTDMDSIGIQEGKDMITLVTCTPVHVNTHRQLVYCEREE